MKPLKTRKETKKMSDTHYAHSFKATAKLYNLMQGSARDGYRHENVEACKQSCPVGYAGNHPFPQGYFACVEFIDHDEMRDFHVNETVDETVDGPFPTEAETLAAAESYIPEIQNRYK